MKGFVLCLHPTENASDVGWRFCSDHRDRWVAMDFEESSIDFTVITAPRFVVGDISYDCKRQYFIKETDGSSSRLLVLEPFIQESENGTTIIDQARCHYRYTGADGYHERKKADASENAENNTSESKDTKDATSENNP